MTLGNKCAYITCGKYSIQVPGEPFYPFPTDLEKREKWGFNSGIILDYSKNGRLFLCKDHFDSNCFENGSLKEDAIPQPLPDKRKSSKKTAAQILSDYSMYMCKSCGNLYSRKGQECECSAFKMVFCTGCNLTTDLEHKCPESLLKKNCIVSRCNSNSKVPTFPLPEDVRLRKAWLDRIPISTKYYPLKIRFFVCSKHFKEDDIIKNDKNISIKKNAIPQGFNLPLAQDKRLEKCCLPYCTSNHFSFVGLTKAPVVTFPFPTDSQVQRREWSKVIFKQYNSRITEGSICIKHFNRNHIFQQGDQCFITHGAVPTKFFLNEAKPNKNVSCCVPHCPTVIEQGVDFFPFPPHGSTLVEVVNPVPRTKEGNTGEVRDMHELWIERIGISDITDLTVICKNHFTENFILYCPDKGPYLHNLAVPTLNLSKPFVPSLVLAKQGIKINKWIGLADTETLHSGGEEEDLKRHCSVPLCNSHLDNNPKRTIHKLPKDLIRARQWADICDGRYWLDQGIKEARKNIRICVNHFQPLMLLPNNRLIIGARPFRKITKQHKNSNTEKFLLPKPKSRKKPNILKSFKPTPKTSQNDELLRSMLINNTVTQNTVFSLAIETIDLTNDANDIPLDTINNKVVNNLPSSSPEKILINPNKSNIQVMTPREFLKNSKLDLPNNVQISFLPENNSQTPQPIKNLYVKCAVDSCDNYFDEGRAEFLGQSYFVFPEDPAKRQLWINAINKPSNWNTSQSRICFRHFTEADVHDGKLLPDAVPTLLYTKPKCLDYNPCASNEHVLQDKVYDDPKNKDNFLIDNDEVHDDTLTKNKDNLLIDNDEVHDDPLTKNKDNLLIDNDEVYNEPLPKNKNNLLIIDNPFSNSSVNNNSSYSCPTSEIIEIESNQELYYNEDIDYSDKTCETSEKELEKQVEKPPEKEAEDVKIPKRFSFSTSPVDNNPSYLRPPPTSEIIEIVGTQQLYHNGNIDNTDRTCGPNEKQLEKQVEKPLVKEAVKIPKSFSTSPVNNNSSYLRPRPTNEIIEIERTQALYYNEGTHYTDKRCELNVKYLEIQVEKLPLKEAVKIPQQKRKRGRPRLLTKKVKKPGAPKKLDTSLPKRRRGRPRKQTISHLRNEMIETFEEHSDATIYSNEPENFDDYYEEDDLSMIVDRPIKKSCFNRDEIIKETQNQNSDTISAPKILVNFNKEDVPSTAIVKEEPYNDIEICEGIIEDSISDLCQEITIKEESIDIGVCTDSFLHEIQIEKIPKNKENKISESIEDKFINKNSGESEIINTFMTYINDEVKKNLEKLPPEKRMPLIVTIVEKMNEFMKTAL